LTNSRDIENLFSIIFKNYEQMMLVDPWIGTKDMGLQMPLS